MTINTLGIWLMDTLRGVASRFTSEPRLERGPTWSPDGKRLMFATRLDLVVSGTAATATPSLVLEDSDSSQKVPSDWSPDGKHALFYRQARDGGSPDIWLLTVDKSRAPEPFLATAATEAHAQFSPDGKWVSYDSDESGRVEVYVRPFRGSGARVRVSLDGGVTARWNPRGGELFFISSDGNLMSASLRSAGNAIEVNRPTRLFPLGTWAGGSIGPARQFDYDVAADGNRFLVSQRVGDDAGWPIHIVANWQPRQP
jgi:Tol biopolymer transport system component